MRRNSIRRLLAVSTLGLAALVAASCSSTTNNSTSTGSNAMPVVAFNTTSAVSFNGPIPTADALKACGNNKYGFIAEIQYTGPTSAKITKHYGPIEPLSNGMPKQMEASGTVVNQGGGNVDLPFDHSFGGDFSMDMALANPYLKLGQNVGTGSGTPKGDVHIEIQMGEFPHLTSDPLTQSVPSTMAWTDYATAAESSIVPGFLPQKGDSIAAQGDWVIDCGHPDFHSELHELSFLAFGHVSGNASVVHAFYNPYLPSELYNSNAALSSQVNDPSLLTSKSDVPLIPTYLVNTVIGVATNKTTTPIAVPMIIAPSTIAPEPFTVCAPSGSGTNLQISYAFDVRPGVEVSKSVDNSTGCVTFTVNFTSSYQTLPPAGQVECQVPWSFINQNASPYSSTGKSLNIQQEIINAVGGLDPSAVPYVQATLQHPLQVNCFDQLGSPISQVSSSGQSVSIVTNQFSPIVGWARVARS